MTKEPTIAEIEKSLELDSIQSIHVSPGMQARMSDDADEMQKWYKEELRAVYGNVT